MAIKKYIAPVVALAGLAQGASLQQVTNFGDNSSGTLMYTYVPDNLASNPAIIVAVHYCTGTAQAYYNGTPYAKLAEQHGFVVIYPESPYDGRCWDVSSDAALTHEGGADSESIANMVRYTLDKYNGDESKVFVTGSSSGAMMTNVLAATYPEMFAAGTVYSGVPAGCFYTGTVDGWNSTCSQGNSIHSQDVWADTVFNMYPGYTGDYPRMKIFHGSADDTLLPPNFDETIKQWTGVFGISDEPTETKKGDPSSAYTTYLYGDGTKVQGVYGQGIGHTVPVMGDLDMEWFGITGSGSDGGSDTNPGNGDGNSGGSGGSSGCSAAHWAQCGGKGFTGCTTCTSGYTCKEVNAFYSQCL